MASGGCRKVAFYAGIGCLAVPIGLALVVGLFLYGASRMGDAGPQHPVPSSFTVPVAPVPATKSLEAAARPAPPAVAGRDLPEVTRPAGAPVRVVLDLSEGDFTVEPGPPGTPIKVDGFFDPKSYELTQTTADGDGGPEAHIRFHRKTPFFFLVFGGHHVENKVTITLPQDVPTALTLRLSRCQSHVELGGMTLTDLDAHFAMGDQNLTFERPVVGRLEQASMGFSMGDIKVRGLGNAHPEHLQIHGSMGDVRVGFDGAWPEGSRTQATARMSMGDFRVTIPRNVRVKSSSSIVLGSVRSDRRLRGDAEQPEDPNAPLLELETHASMGDLSVIRD